MPSRCLIVALALIALLGLVAPARARPGVTTDLACPAGQVTWLRGAAAPGQALLVRFAGATVGGGSAGADGRWAIPLQVAARAGVYPVAVVDRADGRMVATFTCYVNLPVDATPTRTPTARRPIPSSPTTTFAPLATSTTTTPTPPAPSIATTTPLATTSATPAATTTTPAATTATPPGSPPTSPPATATDVPPATPTPPAGTLAIIAVQPDDPAEPGLFEYVVIANRTGAPQVLAGWQLQHRDQGEVFRFPVITVPAGEQVVIWSGEGLDDPSIGSLFWPTSQGRWRPGDTATLRDAAGQRVSRFVVPPPDPGATAMPPDPA